jgi:hypothetical protein
MNQDTTTITLHKSEEASLGYHRLRSTVMAAAAGLAERSGIPLVRMELGESTLSVTLECDELTAVGFAAELRRSTNAWYQFKTRSGPLWRSPAIGSGDE